MRLHRGKGQRTGGDNGGSGPGGTRGRSGREHLGPRDPMPAAAAARGIVEKVGGGTLGALPFRAAGGGLGPGRWCGRDVGLGVVDRGSQLRLEARCVLRLLAALAVASDLLPWLLRWHRLWRVTTVRTMQKRSRQNG